MKIIQSFWTKPFLQSENSLKDARLNGGWPSRKYNYFSWALSCLQLLKYYDSIELVTDDLGKFLLIDKMKLPYTRVTLDLNKLNNFNPGFWALGKIQAYSIQNEPFLHVDNDIFIWSAFEDRIAKGGLVAQNKESSIAEYAQTFNDICQKLDHFPEYLKELEGSYYITCSNAGIMGGTDIDFFKIYTREAFGFVERNLDFLEKNMQDLNSAYINVIFEQIIFHQLSRWNSKDITYLFPDTIDVPKSIGFFHEADKHGGFVHCLGYYKQNRLVCDQLENNLRIHYPQFYYLILDQMDSSEI